MKSCCPTIFEEHGSSCAHSLLHPSAQACTLPWHTPRLSPEKGNWSRPFSTQHHLILPSCHLSLPPFLKAQMALRSESSLCPPLCQQMCSGFCSPPVSPASQPQDSGISLLGQTFVPHDYSPALPSHPGFSFLLALGVHLPDFPLEFGLPALAALWGIFLLSWTVAHLHVPRLQNSVGSSDYLMDACWKTCQRASSSELLIPAEWIFSLYSSSWPHKDWLGILLQTQAPLNKI